jgi:hypothetical protein
MSNDLNASAIRAKKFKMIIHLEKRILLFCMFISVSTHRLGEIKKNIVNTGHQLLAAEEWGWILGEAVIA